jgi:hypothetical protein
VCPTRTKRNRIRLMRVRRALFAGYGVRNTSPDGEFRPWCFYGQGSAGTCLLVAKNRRRGRREVNFSCWNRACVTRRRMHWRYGAASFADSWELVPPELPRHNHGAADGGGNVLRVGCKSPPAVMMALSRPSSPRAPGRTQEPAGSADSVRFRSRRLKSGWKRAGKTGRAMDAVQSMPGGALLARVP